MKLLEKIKSIAVLLLVFGFFCSATLVSCGNKKSDGETTTEQTDEHPTEGDEHPTEEDEHPTKGDEHPK